MDIWIEEFIEERKMRGVSSDTVRFYRTYLGQWADACKQIVPGGETVALRALVNTKSGQTGKAVFRTVKAYELWREEITGQRSWIWGCKRWRWKPAPEYPLTTPEQFTAITALLDTSNLADLRDLTVLMLLWYTGARSAAICRLRLAGIDLAEKSLTILTKGSKRLPIALPDQAVPILTQWLAAGWTGPEWCFPSPRNRKMPITTTWIGHRLRLLAKAAGIKQRVWVHGLRHRALTTITDHSGLKAASRQAAHSSLDMTMKYNHHNMAVLQRAVTDAFAG